MNILHIDSSITGTGSVSLQLTSEIVSQVRRANPASTVTHRDLDAEPLPHLTSKMMAAMVPTNTTDAETRHELAKGFAALDEFMAADVLVIGAPMYNFAVPSQLKAWIDRIAVAGKTFRYTDQGPQGLVTGKKVIVASSRGGIYQAGTPQAGFDFQETYLRAVFGFIGIEDLEFIRAEGVAIGPAQRNAAIKGAIESVSRITRPFAPAKAA